MLNRYRSAPDLGPHAADSDAVPAQHVSVRGHERMCLGLWVAHMSSSGIQVLPTYDREAHRPRST